MRNAGIAQQEQNIILQAVLLSRINLNERWMFYLKTVWLIIKPNFTCIIGVSRLCTRNLAGLLIFSRTPVGGGGGINYGLSTNGGKAVTWQKEWFKNLVYLGISMPGFSQNSYDRIHGFDFNEVKENIRALVRVANEAKFNTYKIQIRYHQYQFNTYEHLPLKEFAEKLGISYTGYPAHLNDLEMTERYFDNLLTIEQMKDISRDIFGFVLQQRQLEHPRDDCNQFISCLTLDENCNVNPCCDLPRDHKDFVIANVLDENFMDKLGAWRPTERCISCIKKGLSPYPYLKLPPVLEHPILFQAQGLPSIPGKDLIKEVMLRVKRKFRRLLKVKK
jgi:hypothetical protein